MSIKHSKLEELPPEVFAYILSYIDQAKSVAALSQASQTLHTLVDANGWSVFVAETFPSFSPRDTARSLGGNKKTTHNPSWGNIARSLVTTNRNWDRRALQACFIQPSGDIVQLRPEDEAATPKDANGPDRLSRHYPGSRLFRSTPGHSPARSDSSTQSETRQAVVTPKQTTNWKLPRGQTMGFTPVIDSYECTTGDKWADRKEVVAYSAGSELILRVRQKPQRQHSSTDDQTYYSSRWATYRPPGAREGVDDITYVKLLNRIGGTSPYDEQILVGTAAGSLQHISARMSHSQKPFNIVRQIFNTGARPIQSASSVHLDESRGPILLATILADLSLCLFPVEETKDAGRATSGHVPSQVVQPISERHLAGDGIRAWRTSFLSSRLLAVSLGPSSHPIHVYQVRPDGLSDIPVSRFSVVDRQNVDGTVTPKSVYPIEPLWDGDGRVFASGGYDGFVRVHDTRSPVPVQYLLEGLEDGPIYSLLARPNAHILAGAARHNVCKVFDLRSNRALLQPQPIVTENGGPPSADPLSLQPPPHDEPLSEALRWKESHATHIPRLRTTRASPLSATWPKSSSYNVYIPRQATRSEGPVYSLSSPSPFSPFIYMGLENSVVEMRIDSVHDAHRDPILTMTSRGQQEDERRDAKRQGRKVRRLERDVLQLKTSSIKGELVGQGPVQVSMRNNGRQTERSAMGDASWRTIEGLDERWIDPRT